MPVMPILAMNAKQYPIGMQMNRKQKMAGACDSPWIPTPLISPINIICTKNGGKQAPMYALSPEVAYETIFASQAYNPTICLELKNIAEQITITITEQNTKINLNVSLAFLTSPCPSAVPTKVETDMQKL